MIVVNLAAESAWANKGHKYTQPHTVRLFFEMHGAPELVAVAACESEFRHVDDEGKVLKNPESSATGVMQISLYWHEERASILGLDLRNFIDNMRYALYLYEKQGLKPWASTESCWSESIAALAGSG